MDRGELTPEKKESRSDQKGKVDIAIGDGEVGRASLGEILEAGLIGTLE